MRMAQPQPRSTAEARLADAELATRVAARDEAALRTLMRRYNQRLFRTARAILRDDAEAEDVVQEAYMKAIAAMGDFRHDAALGTWLVRITVNEALARLRQVRRSAEIVPLAADISSAPILEEAREESFRAPEQMAVRGETRAIVEAGIDALPEAFRTVFVMRALEELSVEETAAILDVPEATVRTRFFRARALLRESLARQLDAALDDAFHFAGERCDRIVARVLRRLGLPA
jgi:RNA polymerase sigma-70 factor (ECF subfamily)